MNRLMKSFNGQDKLSGKYEVDLESILNVFETISEMCDTTPRGMRKAMEIILKGNNLHLLSKKAKDFEKYEEGATMMR